MVNSGCWDMQGLGLLPLEARNISSKLRLKGHKVLIVES